MNPTKYAPRSQLWAAAILFSAQTLCTRADVIANSIDEYSGTQGENGWYYGYRNVTGDAKGINYDATTDFLAFDDWMFVDPVWDLDSAGAAPWTTLARETVHPNGDNNVEEHWAIRRFVPSELGGTTPLAVVWNVRKESIGGGNGVTGALHVNGTRVQSATIAFNDSVGVTNTYYFNAQRTDALDLILSPVGTDGSAADGNDNSYTWMRVETVVDTDADGLPDPWEELYYPGDLTKLSANGDYDVDGLKDGVEMQKGTNPGKPDTDDDGLLDGVETNTGVFVSASNTGTDPTKADTDGDGRKDGDEINVNPKTDPFDPDSDDDTYLDGDEVATGHDPSDGADNPEATAIAQSQGQFSGTQGQNDWYHGYRNFTADGGEVNYNADTGFIAFKGGDGLGDWDGVDQHWTGSQWDLNTAAAGPWTELGPENTHPNTAPVHWTIRRWVATSLTKVTPLALRWHVRKTNTGGGNGVTSGLYINGQKVDTIWIAGNDGTGVTRTYFANLAPGDRVDLILSPRGLDGSDSDGSDGSATRLLVDPTIPAVPLQPDGTIFIPAGAGDTDGDGLPDVWERVFFPQDLTKLTATGDNDLDGLKDVDEYKRDSDPTKPDTDGDGLGDLVETATGVYVGPTNTGSSPKNTDSDGDSLSDATEVNRTPPTDPNKADTDGDTFTDPDEIAWGTSPVDAQDNPLAMVIANSRAEFSGVQGKDGWHNGYRIFDPTGGPVDYNPSQDFIPYPGGEGQGDWDGVTQTWNNGSWDLNTAGAAPWTWQDSIGVHPNGANSEPEIGGAPDPANEHWPIRRWVAQELTADTPVTVIWQVRKANASDNGVTGLVFLNGKLVDSKALAGTDTIGEIRRYRVTLKKGDIVDLALSPEGLGGQREDWSDASETWFWIDTRAQSAPAPELGPATYNAANGTVTLTWSSAAGAKYGVEASANFTGWTKIATGLASGGATTSYTETLASPRPAYRFYRVIGE